MAIDIWENTFENGPVAVFMWENITGEWPVVKVTKNIEQLTGWADEDFLNGTKNFADLIHKDDLSRVEKEEDAWKNQKLSNTLNMSYRIVTKSGETLQVSEFTQNIFDDQGEISHLVGYLLDVTTIRKEELETIRLENETSLSRQNKISNAMVQGIILFEKGKAVFYNNQVFDILEITNEILFEGQTFEDFLKMQVEGYYFGTKKDGQDFINKHLNVVSFGVPYQLERVTKSGKIILVDGVPNKKEDYLTLTFTDITEQKKVEAEVSKNAELLHNTANSLVQGIAVFDDYTLQFYNPILLDLLCISADDISYGISLKEYLQTLKTKGHYADNQQSIQEILETIIDGKLRYVERETHYGTHLHIDIIHHGKGKIILTYTDITERKNREVELEATMKIAESAERAKANFLANMSHEIRTPMNGVMGMAELLASTELDTKQEMYTDVIVKSGASLLTIINDILDFSKIDAGQMELDSAPFNLEEAIEDVATLVSTRVAENNLELIVRVDPALPKIMVGDVGRIRQILTNLLGNAVKFTEQGHVYVNVSGEVTKLDENEAVSLKFSIEDTGIGIPKEQCNKVFDKFSQVDTSTTRKHEGTGLGLSISSSLVKLMDGTIGVTSELGKGSTFWFTIELPTHSEAEKPPVIPGNMEGARILVIDDNEVNRSILAEQLASWDFDGASASSGAEGLEVMRAVITNDMKLDLVILDYQMPDMSGAEVLEKMRNDRALKDIPVVILTSVDSSKTNQRLQQLGAEANLTKPTRSSMLLTTILQVIANKRADIKIQSISNLIVKPMPSLPDSKCLKINKNATKQDPEKKLDILVAEDNKVNQIVFSQILEKTGLNFEVVENGRLALDAYKVQKPSLVLMDVAMPEMNGRETTTAIREYEHETELKRTPIIGVTAHALKGDMELCLDAGMDDYLPKPATPKNLCLKIEQWLNTETTENVTA